MYGERCQFLHSIYDLKRNLTYGQGLSEGARLTQQRYEQIDGDSGADILWANLVCGKGCCAPDKRLSCFEDIYNKETYLENKQKRQDHDKKPSMMAPAPLPFVPHTSNLSLNTKSWKPNANTQTFSGLLQFESKNLESGLPRSKFRQVVRL